jgi:hypothetical protein
VVIRRSSAGEIRRLIEQLTGDDPLARAAASARLAVLGPRAVPGLVAALDREPASSDRARILRTLDAIGDPRAFAPAARIVDDGDGEVAIAAVTLLRALLRSADAPLANAAFERLTAVALDATRVEPVRAAALEAISGLEPATTVEVLRALEEDPSPVIRRAATHPGDVAGRPESLTQLAAATRCPDPDTLRARLAAEGTQLPLSVLGRLVDAFRAREAAETVAPRRTKWQAARAAVHQALAARGSRLALYDARESLATVPGPLPVGFVAALERIGDASCLDAIAAAYLRARQARDGWWAEHLAAAFRAILRREHLTRRSPSVRHVIARWPGAAAELLVSTPWRTTRRRPTAGRT